MNPPRHTSSSSSTEASSPDAMERRLAAQIVAHLNEGAKRLNGDVTARLRFAREQALSRAAQRAKVASAAQVVGAASASATLGWGGKGSEDDSSLWLKLASIIPLLLLIAGLFLIENHFQNEQISAAAEIDAALLTDDLPPDAYRDPGFAEFLKTPRD